MVWPVGILKVPHLLLLLGGEVHHRYSVGDVTEGIVTEK
jgi:hypothetical protein